MSFLFVLTIKPDNILLTNCREITHGGQALPESTRIKIIEFRGGTHDNAKKSSIVTMCQYRAPEVILGGGWSTPSDLCSAGCILAEFFQGEFLLQQITMWSTWQ
jgi:serine/threonine protein kinase